MVLNRIARSSKIILKISSISPLCFGCEPLGGTDWGTISVEEIKYAVDRALDLGINFFDTASVYGLGLSEKRLSSILGRRRKSLFIGTKGGLSWSYQDRSRAVVVRDSSSKALICDVKSSLKRLNLERLPLFYIHWPDPNTSFEETFSTLNELQADGYIEHIGCSNFSAPQLSEALKYSTVSFLQIPLNILDHSLEASHELFRLCKQKHIAIVAYNVLCTGLLTGKYDSKSTFAPTDRRSRLPYFQANSFTDTLSQVDQLKCQANSLGLSLLQYSIQSVLSNDNVDFVITGIKSSSQLVQNWSAVTSSILL